MSAWIWHQSGDLVAAAAHHDLALGHEPLEGLDDVAGLERDALHDRAGQAAELGLEAEAEEAGARQVVVVRRHRAGQVRMEEHAMAARRHRSWHVRS